MESNKCISSGIITSSIWFIIIMSIMDFLLFWTNYFAAFFGQYRQITFAFIQSLALFLAFIPEILSRTIFKQQINKEDYFRLNLHNNHLMESYQKKREADSKPLKCFLLIIKLLAISGLAALQFYLKELLYTMTFGSQNIDKIALNVNDNFYRYILLAFFSMLLTSLFCQLLFKTTLHKHHLVGCLIIFFCLVGAFFVIHFYFRYPNLLIFYTILVSNIIIQAIIPVGQTWLMEYDKMSPYMILFCEGIISLIYTLTRIGVTNQWKEIYSLFIDNNFFILTLTYLTIIAYFFYYLFMILTIKAYSPTHVFLSPSLAGLLIFVAQLTYICFDRYRNIVNFLVFFFAYPIMSFGFLVYNELIILYCFTLEENTMKEIMALKIDDGNDPRIDDGNLDAGYVNTHTGYA